GAFSATTILPGEDPTAFKKTHEDIIAELALDGALEDDIGWTIAHLVWRKKNLATPRIAELPLEHESRVQAQKYRLAALLELEDAAERREVIMKAAEDQARKDLGASYELVEIGEAATVDRLLQDLAVVERLDAMIDKCLKRLLHLRALKSLQPVSLSP